MLAVGEIENAEKVMETARLAEIENKKQAVIDKEERDKRIRAEAKRIYPVISAYVAEEIKQASEAGRYAVRISDELFSGEFREDYLDNPHRFTLINFDAGASSKVQDMLRKELESKGYDYSIQTSGAGWDAYSYTLIQWENTNPEKPVEEIKEDKRGDGKRWMQLKLKGLLK